MEKENLQAEYIYWYGYRLRGFSLGCQPKDFVAHDATMWRLGAVGYERELTKAEIDDYELIFLKKENRKGDN